MRRIRIFDEPEILVFSLASLPGSILLLIPAFDVTSQLTPDVKMELCERTAEWYERLLRAHGKTATFGRKQKPVVRKPRPTHKWTKDGRPICDGCKKVGHLIRECPTHTDRTNACFPKDSTPPKATRTRVCFPAHQPDAPDSEVCDLCRTMRRLIRASRVQAQALTP